MVIHCAGVVSISSHFDKKVYDVNVLGTRNLLALCRQFQVQKLVYVSSVHAIPEKPQGETITETDTFDPHKVKGPVCPDQSPGDQTGLGGSRTGGCPPVWCILRAFWDRMT